jgi:hypothetical protein
MAVGEILSLITIGIGIAAFVFLVRVFNATKSDPFDIEVSKLDLNTLFYTTISESGMKQCKCGNNVVNDFCTEEQLLSGCLNISPNVLSTKKQFLRFLMSANTCNNYREKFNEKKNVNQIFDIHSSKVHSMATGIMVIYIAFFCVLGLLLLAPICAPLIICLFIPIICVVLFGNLVNIILFIIMCAKFYNGATDTYISFLDCSIVNKSKFRDQFEGIESLKTNFTAFLALNIIFVVFNIICNCVNSAKQKEDS